MLGTAIIEKKSGANFILRSQYILQMGKMGTIFSLPRSTIFLDSSLVCIRKKFQNTSILTTNS